jgi:hypothetical protein
MFQFLALAAATVCQTAAGVPCFTLTYEHSVWALVKSPVRDLVTSEQAGTMAVRQDGSTVNRVQPAKRFAIRELKETQRDFRHPVMFYVDRVSRRSTGTDQCRGIVAVFGTNLERLGTSTMLGEPVVNWKFKTPAGDSTVSLAPGLDCQVLRLEAIEYRYRYLPVRKELFEAKSLRRGEPDGRIFTAPKGQ